MSKESDKIHSRKRLEVEYALRRAEYRRAGKAAFGTSANSPLRAEYRLAGEAYRLAGEALKAAHG